MKLPSSWRIALGERPELDGATLVDLTAQSGERSLSVSFFDRGAEALGLRFPIGAAVVLMPAFPTLDDVWTLYMLAACEGDEAVRDLRPKHWEVISHYAEQVRQGFAPERGAPERSVQAVLRSISATALPKQPAKFVDDAVFLCDLTARKVEGGAKLLEDDLTGEEPRLQRHVAFLQEDARVYREDVARGRRYVCTLPARDGKAARALPLLVVPAPLSRMFKVWARRDTSTADGNGFALLLVQDAAGEIVLSADPSRHVAIGWLAACLDAAERERGGTGTWYDGARHEGTLVAAPRSETKLSLDDVVKAIGKQTKLTASSAPKPPRPKASFAAIVAVLVSTAAGTVGIWRNLATATDRPAPATTVDAAAAPTAAAMARAMGPNNPLPAEAKFVNLLDSKAGVQTFTPYAIIMGVCSYGSPGEPLASNLRTDALRHSCNNAWEFAHVLVHDYHYDPKNIVLMIDDPRKVDRPELSPMPVPSLSPTRHNVTSVIENWSKEHDVEKQKMTLVFYYSGHGSVVSGHSTGLPYLQLANWEADIRAHKAVDEAGFAMDRIGQLVKEGIPAKHVLYLFDNCHAGWALGMGEGERLDLQQRWAEGITYGIAASAKDQSAWEPGDAKGTSVFTRFLVEGLELRAGSAALADTDDECGTPDHVVTHAELEAFLRTRVPAAAKKEFNAVQEPVGHRLDSAGAGQFLFVAPDAETHLSSRKCAKKK